jgi:hypothetical protein
MDKHWWYIIVMVVVILVLGSNGFGVRAAPEVENNDVSAWCDLCALVYGEVWCSQVFGCDYGPPPPPPGDTCQSFCEQLDECFWDDQCRGSDEFCSLCDSAETWCAGEEINCFDEHRGSCELRCGGGSSCTEGVTNPDCEEPDIGGGRGSDEGLG